MVKVKLLTSLAGHGFSHGHGEVIEVAEEVAARMIGRGAAEAVPLEDTGKAGGGGEGDEAPPRPASTKKR